MTVPRPDILTSLQAVHDDVQRRVAHLDRYRALKAIEQAIADFASLDDVTRGLTEVRDRVQRQLDETDECRALRTLARIIPDLSEVLALLGDRPAGDAAVQAPEGERASASVGTARHEGEGAIKVPPPPAAFTDIAEGGEVYFIQVEERGAEPDEPAQPEPGLDDHDAATAVAAFAPGEATEAAAMPGWTDPSPAAAEPPADDPSRQARSLSQSLTQRMVQALETSQDRLPGSREAPQEKPGDTLQHALADAPQALPQALPQGAPPQPAPDAATDGHPIVHRAGISEASVRPDLPVPEAGKAA